MDLSFCAKFPFTNEARLFVQSQNISSPTTELLESGSERVLTSLKKVQQRDASSESGLKTQILSFAAARMLLAASGDRYIADKFARAEAKFVHQKLVDAPNETLLKVAKDLTIETSLLEKGSSENLFQLPFPLYLKFRPTQADAKLVNSRLSKGIVNLTRNELINVIEEAIRQRIVNLPELEPTEPMKAVITALKKKVSETIIEAPISNVPITTSKFPPCIAAILDAVRQGVTVSQRGSIPHLGKFTTIVFLLNIGMPKEEIIKLFMSAPNVTEKDIRYQVEYAAQAKYKCPGCTVVETYGLRQPTCPCNQNPNIKSPLHYYNRVAGVKRKMVKK